MFLVWLCVWALVQPCECRVLFPLISGGSSLVSGSLCSGVHKLLPWWLSEEDALHVSATQDRASFTCVPPRPGLCPGISVLPAHLICLPSLRSLSSVAGSPVSWNPSFHRLWCYFCCFRWERQSGPWSSVLAEVEVCCFVFTSTWLSQKTCLVFPFSLSKFFVTFARLYREQVFGLNSKFDWFPHPLNLYPHCFPPIEVRVYRKGQFINQQTKPNSQCVVFQVVMETTGKILQVWGSQSNGKGFLT